VNYGIQTKAESIAIARLIAQRRTRACRQSKSLAERRRNLPPGGQLKEELRLPMGQRRESRKSVKFSELFADKNTLLLYSSCTVRAGTIPVLLYVLVDGFDRTWYSVTQDAAFVAIAKARPIESMRGPNNVGGGRLSWFRIQLFLSSRLQMSGDSDEMQLPVIMYSGSRMERSFIFGELNQCRIMSTQCGPIGISWILRQRVGQTFPLRRKISGPNSWKKTI